MKILFLCGREPEYVRNQIILKSLRKNYEVIEITDASKSFFVRNAKVIFKFFANFKRFDLAFIGFYGQPLVLILKPFIRKPIIFDAFLSSYDTLCFDRKIFKPRSLAGRFFYWLDKYSCKAADRILLDTEAHVNYFVKTFKLPKKKFNNLYVGCDEDIFYPRSTNLKNGPFTVLYYGSFLPLQGIEYIVKAAKLLEKDRDIKFKIIGRGMEYLKIRKLAQAINVTNVEFIEWIPYTQLPIEISKASLCLGGHFSGIDKAKRVIAGKTFQFIAMKKPTIVSDYEANRELFTHKENVYMCSGADEEALASGIFTLKDDVTLRENIASNAFELSKKINSSTEKEIITLLMNAEDTNAK